MFEMTIYLFCMFRSLQMKMDPQENSVVVGPSSAGTSTPFAPPLSEFSSKGNGDTATNLANHIRALKTECAKLKHQLSHAKCETEKKMAEFVKEEKEIKEENLRLQRRLQLEMERREALCR